MCTEHSLHAKHWYKHFLLLSQLLLSASDLITLYCNIGLRTSSRSLDSGHTGQNVVIINSFFKKRQKQNQETRVPIYRRLPGKQKGEFVLKEVYLCPPLIRIGHSGYRLSVNYSTTFLNGETFFFFVRNLINRGIHSRILECNDIQKKKSWPIASKTLQTKKIYLEVGAKGRDVKTPNLAPLGKEGPGAYDLGWVIGRLHVLESVSRTATERRELPGRTVLRGSTDHKHTYKYIVLKNPQTPLSPGTQTTHSHD